jgi:ribosomal-protein-alanine N-acetyltransferase
MGEFACPSEGHSVSSQLVSARLVLAPFVEADISLQYVGWLNDPEVVRYSNQRFLWHDMQSCKAYLNSFNDSPNQFWSVRLAADWKMIGTMTAYLAPQHGTADIGLLIGERSVWGQGYGYEAWQTLMSHLFGEYALRKITAGTASGNVGMIKIIERSGMCHEATRKQQELIDGDLQDIVYFAKFRVA